MMLMFFAGFAAGLTLLGMILVLLEWMDGYL